MKIKLEYKWCLDVKRYDTKSTRGLMFFVPSKPIVAKMDTIHENNEEFKLSKGN